MGMPEWLVKDMTSSTSSAAHLLRSVRARLPLGFSGEDSKELPMPSSRSPTTGWRKLVLVSR
jgi:hypothetical protein